MERKERLHWQRKKLKFFLYFCVRGPENVMAVSTYKDLSKELKICVTWMFPNLEIPMGRKIKVSRLSLLKISCIILACSEKSVLPLVILMTNHVGKCPRLLWTGLCSQSEEEGFASSVFDNMKLIGVHIGRLMQCSGDLPMESRDYSNIFITCPLCHSLDVQQGDPTSPS